MTQKKQSYCKLEQIS